jgi:hypothetical protein
MARVKTESRSRVAIEWYDSEDEADSRSAEVLAGDRQALAQANIGFVQCGRDSAFDMDVNGEPAYAVVTP